MPEPDFTSWPSFIFNGVTFYVADTWEKVCTGLIGAEEKSFRGSAIFFPNISGTHSHDCFFPIDTIYLSNSGKILERRIKPVDENFVTGPVGTKHIIEIDKGLLPEWQVGIVISKKILKSISQFVNIKIDKDESIEWS